jgi:hypothetical protein
MAGRSPASAPLPGLPVERGLGPADRTPAPASTAPGATQSGASVRPFRSFQCICVLTLLAVAAPGMTPAPGPVADEASIARTADALGPGFRRSETARFVVLSDGSPEWTRGTSRLLESTYDRVVRMMNHLGLRVSAPPHKLECVLIEDHARFEAFATAQDGVRSRWLGGYYATFSNRVVFYHSGTAPEFLRARRQLDSIEEEGAKAGRLA